MSPIFSALGILASLDNAVPDGIPAGAPGRGTRSQQHPSLPQLLCPAPPGGTRGPIPSVGSRGHSLIKHHSPS